MRKLLAGLTAASALALVAGLVVAVPADASISTPGNGANLRGTATFSATGTGSSGYCADTGRESSTTLQLVNSSGSVIHQSSASGSEFSQGSSTSFSYETEDSPNGTYTVRDNETYYYEHGFLSCSTRTNNYTETVHFANQSSVSYSGNTSGHPGQTVTVSATLRESGGNNVTPPAGQVVHFSLSGGNTVSATTNGSGVATTSLPVTGAPRGATLTTSYPAQYYAASSTSTGFTVAADPSNVTVHAASSSPAYGQADTFSASVDSTTYGNDPNGTPTGTIQFEVDGTDFGSPVTMSGGAASITDPSLGDVGPYTVAAVYSGDSNYSGNSGSIGVTVGPAATATAIAAAPTSSVYGQSVTFTATVTTQPPGAGAPLGSVTFQVNGSPFGGGVPVGADGEATSPSLSTLAADTYQITAIFTPAADGAGNVDFSGSQSTIAYTVGQASTTTTEVSSVNPYAVYGQPVEYTATVNAVAPGAGTPSGSVDFEYQGVSPGSSSEGAWTDLGPGTLSGGNATSPSISTLNPGYYEIEAIYGGDTNFLGSSTSSLHQDVTPDPTTTVLTSTVDPSVYGQPVTVTAGVSANAPGSGNPTGQVDFQIESTAPGSSGVDLGDVALSAGMASITLPTEPAGTYTVTATYEGSPEADFYSSMATLTQTVQQDPTTTVVASSVPVSVYGQPVTLTATVSADAPGAGTPTGTVEFFDGSNELGSGTLAAGAGGDQASLSTDALAVGSHAITATYESDPDFLGSSGSVTQQVNQAQTTTTVTPNGTVLQGQPVTFSASVAPVAPGAGTPTGTVQFSVNGAPLGSPVTVVDGMATSTAIADLSPGTYQASAAYSGDTDFLASRGSVGQSVTPAATTTTLVVTPDNSWGSPVDLTATVTPTAPGAGAPSGTVEFFDGSSFVAEASLDGTAGSDQASADGVPLAVGTHALQAVYVGDYNFATSTGGTTWVVPVVATATTLASTTNPSDYGAPVTFTATVVPQATGGPAPTGTVTFNDGSTAIGTVRVQVSAGVVTASLTVSNLAVGSHSIAASYSGDRTYGTSATAAALTQQVVQAPTTLAAQSASSAGVVTATLSTAQGPVAGETLTFTVGSTTLCSAVTGTDGTATCTATGLGKTEMLLEQKYTVTFAGDPDYVGAAATGTAP